MNKKRQLVLPYLTALAIVISVGGMRLAAAAPGTAVDTILDQIETLEGKSDPKCYATASRLEDFMFGTPLTGEARNEKNDLQKALVSRIWLDASDAAAMAGESWVDAARTQAAVDALFTATRDGDGHWTLAFPGERGLRINGTDKRQYSSIAYSLRAILAVQQEALMDPDSNLLPLSEGAVEVIKDASDLYTLSVLKIADTQARAASEYELQVATVVAVWSELLPTMESSASQPSPVAGEARYADLSLTNAVIDRKVRAYAKYNDISNQLFVRNLQVYFAKRRWPETSEEATAFRGLFTEALIAMARDIYLGSESVALARGSALIQERDVAGFLGDYMPHEVNQYEDAIFFPRLPRNEQVFIEAYDMDAFRDSGIHWRYLQFAIQSDGFRASLEPDPFALELITESIAQLGVLLLRLTGEVTLAEDRERLATSHLSAALDLYQDRVAANNTAPEQAAVQQALVSSAPSQPGSDELLFSEVTEVLGIDFMHRSSDWLNRQLRSYLRKDENTGIITIPPAFGGAGVAVGDVNNDGRDDILLLGGLGNRLYVNRGSGRFEDITQAAGLAWVREQDKNPGEPRQPLLADLDNDGDQDVVITYVDDPHRVYRNNGDETFIDVTDGAGLGGAGLVGGPATVFDYDNDGLLDIYITYFGNYLNGTLPTLERRNYNGTPNKLFRNRGGFKFEDVTAGSGLDNGGWAQAVTHSDLNRDGLQDVVVGNDFGVNAYYINQGNGRFIDVAPELGTDKPSYTMGIGLADLNDDRVPDIYISNIVTMNKDQKYVLPEAGTTMVFNPDKLANMRVVEANDLFLSSLDDEGAFSYQLSDAVERGYSSTGWSWGAEFFDSDNDGDDDLYVLNGMNEFNLYSSENPYYTDPLENEKKNVYIPVDTRETNVFFLNQGGRLNNISVNSGLDLRGNSRSAAYLDFDADGDLDIVVNNYHEAARAYRNDSAPAAHGWLKVTLLGDPGEGVNRDAIGARLLATTADGERVWREIHGSSGYMTVQSRQQHFGLGTADGADLEVVWPNGKRQVFEGLAAGHLWVITYGEDRPVVPQAP